MGVDHAPGVAGGARRVAHRRSLVLVLDPEPGRRAAGQQLLVAQHPRVVGQLGGAAVVHHHDGAHRAERVQQRPELAEQAPVGEHHFVGGVVGDVGQLVGEQPDVERVQHAPAARCREVHFQVPGGVPAERGDPAVRGYPERVQRAGQPAGAVGPIAVAEPLHADRGRGNDRLVGEHPLRPFEDGH